VLRSGLASTPLILTIASRPVWGINCTLSGQLSGNLSDQQNQQMCAGEGLSPNFWKAHPELWHYNFPPQMPFSSVFGVNAFVEALGQPLSLYSVIKFTGVNLNLKKNAGILNFVLVPCEIQEELKQQFQIAVIQLGFQSVAALQNAATAVKYNLNVKEVIDTFNLNYASCNAAKVEMAANSLDFLNNQGSSFSG
jgi:hypothetical protein